MLSRVLSSILGSAVLRPGLMAVNCQLHVLDGALWDACQYVYATPVYASAIFVLFPCFFHAFDEVTSIAAYVATYPWHQWPPTLSDQGFGEAWFNSGVGRFL